MKPATLLRIIGAAVLLGVLVLTGTYNIGGVPLLVMTLGFAVAFERLAVSAAKTNPKKGFALAAAIIVALGGIAAMSLPAAALRQALPSIASGNAESYPDCLLETLPGVQNDAAAHAAYQVCISKFPAGFEDVAQGAGRAAGAFSSGAECTLRMASATQSQRAGQLIGVACRKLYDEDGPWMNYR